MGRGRLSGEGEEEDSSFLHHYMDADSSRIVPTGTKANQLSGLKKQARIDLAEGLEQVDGLIRGCDPSPGAWPAKRASQDSLECINLNFSQLRGALALLLRILVVALRMALQLC